MPAKLLQVDTLMRIALAAALFVVRISVSTV